MCIRDSIKCRDCFLCLGLVRESLLFRKQRAFSAACSPLVRKFFREPAVESLRLRARKLFREPRLRALSAVRNRPWALACTRRDHPLVLIPRHLRLLLLRRWLLRRRRRLLLVLVLVLVVLVLVLAAEAAHLLSFFMSSPMLSLPLLSGSHSSKSWFSNSALSCALGTSSPSSGIALRHSFFETLCSRPRPNA